MTNKTYPKVGDHLYLSTLSGDFYGDLVRRPYTVVEVNKGIVKVQKCQLIFNGPRYYNTMADDIKEDKNGKIDFKEFQKLVKKNLLSIVNGM